MGDGTRRSSEGAVRTLGNSEAAEELQAQLGGFAGVRLTPPRGRSKQREVQDWGRPCLCSAPPAPSSGRLDMAPLAKEQFAGLAFFTEQGQPGRVGLELRGSAATLSRC